MRHRWQATLGRVLQCAAFARGRGRKARFVHGQKDARDIIRILLLAKQQGFNAQRSILFMRDDHLARLKLIIVNGFGIYCAG